MFKVEKVVVGLIQKHFSKNMKKQNSVPLSKLISSFSKKRNNLKIHIYFVFITVIFYTRTP